METVEETPLQKSSMDGMKISNNRDENDENVIVSAQSDVCQKSNGVADTAESDSPGQDPGPVLTDIKTDPEITTKEKINNQVELDLDLPPELPSTESANTTSSKNAVSLSSQSADTTSFENADPLVIQSADPSSTNSIELNINESSDTMKLKDKEKGKNEISKEFTGTVAELITNSAKSISVEEVIIEESTFEVNETFEPSNDTVTFQTEVVVEANDNDVVGYTSENIKNSQHDSVGIVNELGQNIELTEALRASDVTENVENNNCTIGQEVFNKEELLDILEGNDEELANNTTASNVVSALKVNQMTETQIALQQLSRLKSTRKRSREKITKKKLRERRIIKVDNTKEALKTTQEEKKGKETIKSSQEDKKEKKTTKTTQEDKKEDSIINVLVKDWEDEDPAEECNKLLQESVNLLKVNSDIVKEQEFVTKQDVNSDETADTSTDDKTPDISTDDKTPDMHKTGEDSQPQRRLGRVIKKKVIFDPDNPDTFTKSKVVVKSKEPEPDKEQQTPKKCNEELPTPKKCKVDPVVQRSNSKSPVSKLQWKKPSSKPSCKQNKRLTEVDRLLMDEGAVNMIYQLTPEAPKGKKNMRTKAEFIKKVQSSTPDSKEMKFRERKKELKYEESEPKKIIGGKQRTSLSSSVKSPTVSEDFEAHSADDSIIYRRHSSSSYSSSCMSPRRLSDVESTPQPHPLNSLPVSDSLNQSSNDGSNEIPTDVFMPDGSEILSTEIINKDDCLSIKEKLNSKLNLALNKRKRESAKGDKPSKIKKVVKPEEIASKSSEDYKHLSIKIDQKLAEICILKTGSKCNAAILKEIETALAFIETKKDISVTLLSAECAMLCSDLDLRPLLDDNVEKKTKYALEILESVRSLLQAVHHHSKLVCSGVSGRCSGVGLALVGLSDVVLASERASFSISQKSHTGATPLVPGIAVLTAHCQMPQALLNDLVVFGRRLSAGEALRGGLVSRALWPARLADTVRALARDIATQPEQNVLLKKQLLNLKQSGSGSTFQSCLERERDLLVQYWTSAEGQELLRNLYNTS